MASPLLTNADAFVRLAMSPRGIQLRYVGGLWSARSGPHLGHGQTPEAAADACYAAWKWAEMGDVDGETADGIGDPDETISRVMESGPLPVALR